MAQIDVSLENMAKANNIFAEKSATARRLLSQADEHIQSIRSFWTGSAATSFTNSIGQWHSEFEIVIKELDAIRDKLGAVTKGYQSAHSNTEQIAGGGLF